MYEALVKAADEKVLVLMSDSLGALNEGGRGTILEFKQRVQNLFIIVSVVPAAYAYVERVGYLK